jgi:hypothetical protein
MSRLPTFVGPKGRALFRHALRLMALAGGGVVLSACAVATSGVDGVTFEAGGDSKADANRDAAPQDGDVDAGEEVTFSEDSSADASQDAVIPTFDVVDEIAADTFVFKCDDTNYDVNGDPSDGCEVKDPLFIHSEGSAHDMGHFSDNDADKKSVTSTFPSDDRMHQPSGRNGAFGLPVWYSATHDQTTFYVNDPTFNVSMSGGTGTYRVTFLRGDGTEDPSCSPAEINGAGSTGNHLCGKTAGSEVIHIKLEKLSGPRENPSYTVTYHN